MTWTGCDETAYWITRALEESEVCSRVRTQMSNGAGAPELVRAIALDLPDRIKERVERELGELPAAAVLGILAAWQTADASQMPFLFESVKPEAPLDLARRRSVRVVIDVNEDGVRAGLSHIPSRHPTWAVSAS